MSIYHHINLWLHLSLYRSLYLSLYLSLYQSTSSIPYISIYNYRRSWSQYRSCCIWGSILLTDCGTPTRAHPNIKANDFNVDIQQQPWMVSLGVYRSFNDWEHQCGGSLITRWRWPKKNFALTKNMLKLGSGCGSIGRAVVSEVRGSNPVISKFIIWNIYLPPTVLKRQNKEKEEWPIKNILIVDVRQYISFIYLSR